MAEALDPKELADLHELVLKFWYADVSEGRSNRHALQTAPRGVLPEWATR